VEERKVERVEVDGMELHVEQVDEEGSDQGPHTALPPRVESWRRRSVTGAVLTGFALGLREALEPERQEAPIIVQVSGDPVDDLAVEAQVDELNPAESVVTVRRWLLREIADEEAAAARVDDDVIDGDAGGAGGDPPGPPAQ
jgi:hypothetical protein